MKSVDAAVLAAVQGDTDLVPKHRVRLWQTPYPTDSLGPNFAVYKNTITVTGDPWMGERIGASFAPYTSDIVTLAEAGKVQCLYGYERPFGLSPSEPHVFVWEGYFTVPTVVPGTATAVTTIRFKLVANGSPASMWFAAGSTQYPVDVVLVAAERINVTQVANRDDATETLSADIAVTAGSVHSWRVDLSAKAGQFVKLLALYQVEGGSDTSPWMPVDASVIHTATTRLSATTLAGVVDVSGRDQEDSISTVAMNIAKTGSNYDWNVTTESHGILRPGYRITVETGFNVNGDDTDYTQAGEFFINSVKFIMRDSRETFLVQARDFRGRVQDAVNLLYPNILSYDLAGIDAANVFDEPEGELRWVAYDSFKLTDAVRDLLWHAGALSNQLYGYDADGNALFEDNDIRLDRGTFYRLKLNDSPKDGSFKWELDPGEAVLSIIEDMVSTFGYDFGMQPDTGEFYLRERNNGTPLAVDSFTAGGTWLTIQDDISAHGGRRRTASTGGGTMTYAVAATTRRVRLIFARKAASAGTFSATFDGNTIASSVDLQYEKTWAFNDGIDPSSGENPCVFEYNDLGATTGNLVVTAAEGAEFQGAVLISRDPDDDAAVLDKTRVTFDIDHTDRDIRNDVIVAGSETGIDTGELLVSRAEDVGSYARPSRPNYIGYRRQLIVPDDRINQKNRADYVAVALVREWANTLNQGAYYGTYLPQIQPGDTHKLFDPDDFTTEARVYRCYAHEWALGNASASSTIYFTSRRFLPSFRNPFEPASPPATVEDFVIDRTDGGVIDPRHSAYAGTTVANADIDGGYYMGQWSDLADPVHLVVSFKLWKSSYVTLDIKDAYSNRVVARLLDGRFLEWGEHTFLYDGKWYSQDGNKVSYYPADPDDGRDITWDEYQDKPDLLAPCSVIVLTLCDTGTYRRKRSGYIYAEAHVDPASDLTAGTVWVAENADVSTTSLVKIILPPNATSREVEITSTVAAIKDAPDNVPHGGRYEIDERQTHTNNDQSGDDIRGVRHELSWAGEDLKWTVEGWLDLHVLVLEDNTDWTVRGGYYTVRQRFTPESLAIGRHFWQIANAGVDPWTVNLIAGETAFLPAATYDMMLSLEGLQVVPDVNATFGSRDFGLIRTVRSPGGFGRDVKVSPGLDPELLRVQRYAFRRDYLEQLAFQYPGKYVGASFTFGLEYRVVNRVGENVHVQASGETYDAYNVAYRLENLTDYSAKKHMIWPPTAMTSEDPGGTETYAAGGLMQLRAPNPGGSTIVHLTMKDSVNGVYD